MVTGSGPRGRITVDDVEAFKKLEKQVLETPHLVSMEPSSPPQVIQPIHTAPPPKGATYTDLDLSNMRKTIAKRLTESKQNIPHYYLSVDVVMDEVVE